MQATLTENEVIFNSTLKNLRSAEKAFDGRLSAFAQEAAEEIAAHERHRAALARLNSEIGRVRDAVLHRGEAAVSRKPLPPAPPMKFGTAEKVTSEFSAKIKAAQVRLKKGA